MLSAQPSQQSLTLTPEMIVDLVRQLAASPGFSNWQLFDEIFTTSRKYLHKHKDAWRFGPSRVAEVGKESYDRLSKHTTIQGKTYLEIGCGKYHPFGILTYFYLNGISKGIAIDACKSDTKRAAEAIYDELTDALARPNIWYKGEIYYEEFLARIRSFNLEALQAGDLENGLNGLPFEHQITDASNLQGIPSNYIDLISSRSVLEHCKDLRNVFSEMYRTMKPGAVGFHSIDLRDHRYYSTRNFNDFWLFLRKDDPEPNFDGGINKLRSCEILDIIKTTNLEILEWKTHSEPLPIDLREQLRPEYQHFSDKELAIVAAYATIRKTE